MACSYVLRHRGTRSSRQRTQRGLRNRSQPVELPYAPVPSCTAHPRAYESKSELRPNSWARVRPVTFGLRPPRRTTTSRSYNWRAPTARHSITRLLGRMPWWWTCKEPLWQPQTAHHTAHARRWPCLSSGGASSRCASRMCVRMTGGSSYRRAWISSWRPPLWSLGATEGTISTATIASALVGPVRTAESAVVAENSCPSAGFACGKQRTREG